MSTLTLTGLSSLPLFSLSACVTPPGLRTALQSPEYGSSACLQTFSKAVGRCAISPVCYKRRVCPLRSQVMVASLLSAGSCQKRFREDAGSDDRDFIKRMKGDFGHRHSCFRESQLDPIIQILRPTSQPQQFHPVPLLFLF